MLKLPSTIKLNNDTFMCFLSFLFFSISNISRMFELIGVPRAVPYALYLVVFAAFVLKTIKQAKLYDYLYFAIVIPVVVLGAVMYRSYIPSDSSLYVMFIVFIPSYYFFRLCNFEFMLKGLVASAYYSVVYLLIYYVLYVSGSNTAYDMSYAGWIASPMCVLFYCYLRKRWIVDLILTLASSYTLIASGSRGALALSALAMVYLFMFTGNDQKKEKTKIGWMSALGLLVIVFWNPFLKFLNENFEGSRNVEKLISGEFLKSPSRNAIYEHCEELFSARPNGYGPLASRQLMGSKLYPHSLFYELQLDYGKIIGFAVFVFIILATVVVLWVFRKNKLQIIAALTCIIGIGTLFVSSSYFHEMYVPAVIAIFVTIMEQKRKRKTLWRPQ